MKAMTMTPTPVPLHQPPTVPRPAPAHPAAPIKALSPLWAVLLLLPFLSFQVNTKLCHDHDTNIDADAANCGDHQVTSAANSPSPCKSSVLWASMKASRSLCKTLLLILFFLLSSSQMSAHRGHDHDADGDEQDNLRSRGLIAVKIWCLVILLVSTFEGGVSPYYGWNESFLVMGTQFAGGVFLGTSLIHFLADANSTFADLTSKTYPFYGRHQLPGSWAPLFERVPALFCASTTITPHPPSSSPGLPFFRFSSDRRRRPACRPVTVTVAYPVKIKALLSLSLSPWQKYH